MPDRFEKPAPKTRFAFDRHNEWRVQQISEELRGLGISVQLPHDEIIQYLAEMAPDIADPCPLVTHMDQLKPLFANLANDRTIRDRLQFQDSFGDEYNEERRKKNAEEMLELRRENALILNQIAALRSYYLILNIATGMLPDDMSKVVQEELSESAIVMAAELDCELPAAWTAEMKRERITHLLGAAYQTPDGKAAEIEELSKEEGIDEEGVLELMGELGLTKEQAVSILEAENRVLCEGVINDMDSEKRESLVAYFEVHPDPKVLTKKLLNIDRLERLVQLLGNKPSV